MPLNVVNGPQYPKLTYGKPLKLGSLVSVADTLQFSVTGGSSDIFGCLGSIIFQIIANGTVTSAHVGLGASCDGGTNTGFQTGAVGGGSFSSNTPAIDVHLAGNSGGLIINLQIPSLAGQITMRLVLGDVVYGTASKFDVWALVG